MTTSLLTAKVISLCDARNMRSSGDRKGRDEMMLQGAERRIEAREACDNRLFAQVTACTRQDLIGSTFSCRATDTSAGGLCLNSAPSIPADAKLDLWIENTNQPGKFFLTSDVRWVLELADGSCAIGVELQNNPTTDIDQWQQRH